MKLRRKMNWIPFTKDDLPTLKKYESVLMFHDSDEYPYDIVQYYEADEEEDMEEFWHSFLHINANQYEYSTQELVDSFTHYYPLVRAIKRDKLWDNHKI